MTDPAAALIDRLNEEVSFPAHGYAVDEAGWTHLVLPIIAATAAVQPFEKPSRTVKTTTDLQRVGAFRKTFMKVLTLLRRIRSAELLARRSADDLENAPSEDWMSAFAAQSELILDLEVFFLYFRILADHFAVALGYLVSQQRGVFPDGYSDVLKKARRGFPSSVMASAAEREQLARAITEHTDWFDLLRAPGGSHEGLRDAVAHGLVDTQLSFQLDNNRRAVGTHAQFYWPKRPPSQQPSVDLLEAVGLIVQGFCAFLSALPHELWGRTVFGTQDSMLRSQGPWDTATEFFPSLLSAVRD